MNFISLIKKKIAAVVLTLFTATAVMAQADATSPATVTSENNQLAILLIIMTVVLAFVIWGLGQVLIVLSKQLVDKSKKSGHKALTTIMVLLFMAAAQSTFAQNAAVAKETVTVVPNYGGLSSSTFYMFVSVILAEIITILFLALAIRRIYTELLPEKARVVSIEKASSFKIWWAGLDKKIFTRAIPVEKEADIMLDHDYDGIRELDNALPPWWKYGFYITIVIAFIYIFNFHVWGNGKSPTEEYAVEMQNAQIAKDIYEAKNKDKIDETNVPMADMGGLSAAKEIFNTKCWACHGKLGEGGAGPNLTDDYWLHKGSMNDIYHTIKNGYPDKGMQSWASVYTPKEMSYLASYVKKLRGTNPPNAKAAQGDLYTDAAAAAPAGKDSVKTVKPDSTGKSLSKN